MYDGPGGGGGGGGGSGDDDDEHDNPPVGKVGICYCFPAFCFIADEFLFKIFIKC